MKNLLLKIFLTLSLVSCSAIMIDQKVLDAWIGAPVEFLDSHSFFASLPVSKTYTENGVEIRNYKNRKWINGTSVTCNNMFYIKDKKVLEYVLVGRCKTMPSLVPEKRTLDLNESKDQMKDENKRKELEL